MSDYIERKSIRDMYSCLDPNARVLVGQVLTDIDAIPTIDAVSVVQGKWIEDYNGNGWNDYWDYTCSNCGKRYERADAVLCKANFCPNCGARMRGADDE